MQSTFEQELWNAIEDTEIPRLYFNGFNISIGNADVTMILKLQNNPVMILSMSHNLAKTLVEKMGGVVSILEDKIDQRVLTTDQIAELMQTNKNEEADSEH